MEFHKYQGTGNDFVCIDNRKLQHSFTTQEIEFLANRKFGIGSDGVILIQEHPDLDFHMVFFNPDGSQSFCGNGSRCAMLFARDLEIVENQANFLSTDGPHSASFLSEENDIIGLEMHNVSTWEERNAHWILNTGSPHYIIFHPDIDSINILQRAHQIRYSDEFEKDGINVNFVQELEDNSIAMRTYERGVENETLSCGTGVTAAALSWALKKDKNGKHIISVQTRGGSLSVSYERSAHGFKNIVLSGPAQKVFSGEIQL
jgi:diaminopimelate epimerase